MGAHQNPARETPRAGAPAISDDVATSPCRPSRAIAHSTAVQLHRSPAPDRPRANSHAPATGRARLACSDRAAQHNAIGARIPSRYGGARRGTGASVVGADAGACIWLRALGSPDSRHSQTPSCDPAARGRGGGVRPRRGSFARGMPQDDHASGLRAPTHRVSSSPHRPSSESPGSRRRGRSGVEGCRSPGCRYSGFRARRIEPEPGAPTAS